MTKHRQPVGHGAWVDVDDDTYRLTVERLSSGKAATVTLTEEEYAAIWDLPDEGKRVGHVHDLVRRLLRDDPSRVIY